VRIAIPCAAYGAIASVAILVRASGGGSPLVIEGWFDRALPPGARLLASVALGALVAAGTLAATPLLVRRSARVRRPEEDLRPVVHGATHLELALLAFASGLAEELLFRGTLLPMVGLVVSSAAFGLLHQMKGPARWVWTAWAATLGLALGVVVAATGHVAGAVLAHVVINAHNLRRLRSPDVAGRHARLGGLLRSA